MFGGKYSKKHCLVWRSDKSKSIDDCYLKDVLNSVQMFSSNPLLKNNDLIRRLDVDYDILFKTNIIVVFNSI